MKALKGLIAALFVAAPLFANAYTTSWEQNIDFNPDPLVTTKNSYSFKHDLTTVGFTPLSDLIWSYDLTISVYDDNKGWDEFGIFETVSVEHGGLFDTTKTFSWNWGSGTVESPQTLFGLITLNALGELWVTVESNFGDFYLDSSNLVAEGWTHGSNNVPEPSSLALLAAGLFGIAAMRRSATRNS